MADYKIVVQQDGPTYIAVEVFDTEIPDASLAAALNAAVYASLQALRPEQPTPTEPTSVRSLKPVEDAA